jgi:hypothetical protein
MVGEAVDLTYKYEHLGSDPAALAGLLAAGSPVMERLKAAKAPAVVVGPGVLRRADRDVLMRSVHQLVEKAGEWDVAVQNMFVVALASGTGRVASEYRGWHTQ